MPSLREVDRESIRLVRSANHLLDADQEEEEVGSRKISVSYRLGDVVLQDAALVDARMTTTKLLIHTSTEAVDVAEVPIRDLSEPSDAT